MTCAPWPVVWPKELDPSQLPAAAVEAAVQAATDTLWALTGRVFGNCTVTERFRVPAGSGCVGPYLQRNGVWANGVAGGCGAVRLTFQPVQSVVTVRLDGVVVTDWFLQRGALVRDGACWPAVSVDEPANLEVVYDYGAGVPAGAGQAVGELATELLASYRDKECRLPGRVTSTSRNGVTVTMLDVTTLETLGLTGMPISDMLIRSLNPSHLRQPSRVFSVDGPRRA
jgi:hypothetical protein